LGPGRLDLPASCPGACDARGQRPRRVRFVRPGVGTRAMSALPYRPTGDQPRGRGLADMLIEHDEIVAWAETRNATPIVIAQSRHPHEFARLSLRFPDEEPGALYEPVEWHRWFALF